VSLARICHVCEDPIHKGEPQMTVSGQPIHVYCDLETGGTCDTENCAWRWCVHAGECST
jgi:hypothetical protein